VARAPVLLRAVGSFVALYRPGGYWAYCRELPKRWIKIRSAKVLRTFARRLDRDLGRVEDDLQLGEISELLEVLRPSSSRDARDVDVDAFGREVRRFRELVQTAESIKLVAGARRDEWRRLFCAAVAWCWVVFLQQRPPISRDGVFGELLVCALAATGEEKIPEDVFDLVKSAVEATQGSPPDRRVQRVLDRLVEESRAGAKGSATTPTP